MKNKRFVTLYYKGVYNAYMVKDIGQLSYALHKYHGYDAVLAGAKCDPEYPLLASETPGLKLEFIKKGKKIWRMFELPTVLYLFKHAKEIDVLNLYFAKNQSLFYGLLYKWLNPYGVLYVKLDANLDLIKKAHSCFYPTKNLIRRVVNSVFVPLFFKKTDLFSIEQKEGLELAKQFHPKYADKFIYLPNGVSESFLEHSSHYRPFSEKENIILFVGRVGIREKNNEMLLEALESVELKDWKVVFVGPIKENFCPTIDAFYEKCPQLRDKVLFTGPVYDRTILAEWYDRAKVFCLTSIQESFGIVMLEAMFYNNYIVTTDISSAADITDNGRVGTIIKRKDSAALSGVLQQITDGDVDLGDCFGKSREYANENFRWAVLANQLHKRLQDNIKDNI